jgi:mercuric ion transport protein
MSSEQKLSARTAAAAVFTGLLASACCIGPLVLAILGIGGAGLLVKFEPYRPYFMGFTFLLLALGFYFAYFRKPAATGGSVDECGCEKPQQGKWGKVMLWVATVVSLLAMASPQLLASFSDGSFSKAKAGPKKGKQATAKQVTLELKGMTCAGCVPNVTRALKGIPGIYKAQVTYKPQRAVIRFNPQKTNPGQFIAAIKKAGYQARISDKKKKAVGLVKVKQVTLEITGMTCGGCIVNVKNALKKVKGIVSASITYKPQRAVIRYHAKKARVGQMIAAIQKAGYKAKRAKS